MSFEGTPEVIPATQEEEQITPKCQTALVSVPPTLKSEPCHRATHLGSLWSHMLAEEMAAQAQYEDKPKEEEQQEEAKEEAHTDQPSAGHSLAGILMQMLLRRRRQPRFMHLVEEDNQSLLLMWIVEKCAVLEMMSKLIWTELRTVPMLAQSLTPKREKLFFLNSKGVWGHSSTHHKSETAHRATPGTTLIIRCWQKRELTRQENTL